MITILKNELITKYNLILIIDQFSTYSSIDLASKNGWILSLYRDRIVVRKSIFKTRRLGITDLSNKKITSSLERMNFKRFLKMCKIHLSMSYSNPELFPSLDDLLGV